MNRTQSYRWRVYFSNGTPCRDVTATSEDGAKRTAVYAERITGNKSKRLKAVSAERLWAVGWSAAQSQP